MRNDSDRMQNREMDSDEWRNDSDRFACSVGKLR